MHGEKLVVEIVGKDVSLWKCQLQTHAASQQTCNKEKAERRHDIALADGGVVYSLEPADEARRFPPHRLKARRLRTLLLSQFRYASDWRGRDHFSVSRYASRSCSSLPVI